MKKFTLALCLFLIVASTYGQQAKGDHKKVVTDSKCSTMFITTSTGLNNSNGLLAVGAEYEFVKQVGVDAGFGVSSWGYKMNVGFQYFFKPCHKGWTIGLGVTHNLGLSNFQTSASTIYGNNEQVTLDLHPVTNFYIATHYYANLGQTGKNKFFLMLGWSQALTANTFNQVYGDPINDATVKAYNFLKPGGLIAAIGFGFGIN